MNKPLVANNIEVGGVILTDQLIAQLKQLQEHENYYINYIRNGMADAICLIAQKFNDLTPDELKKAQEIVSELSLFRDYFNDFKKP